MNKRIIESKIIAEGEATGHYHRIVGNAVVYEDEQGIKVDAKEPVNLTHEEHKTITLPAKKYRTGKVIEYDHFAEMAREVRD